MSPLGLAKDLKHKFFFPNHVPFTPLICGVTSGQSIRLPNIEYDVFDLIKKEANLENIKKEKSMN
jgi:hypothetical protein